MRLALLSDIHGNLTALDAEINGRRVVNLGSLSNHVLPEIYASYVLLEAEAASHHLEIRRVDYDGEEVIRQMQRAHCPATAFVSQCAHCPATAFVSQFLRGERHAIAESSAQQALQQLIALRAQEA